MIHLPKFYSMKAFLVVMSISLFLFSCDVRNYRNKNKGVETQGDVQFKDSTTVQVTDSLYNFGSVKDGENVAHNFTFKNTGTHPLIIETARPSCGCTIAEKPEKPVLAGESGIIRVVFNSSGRVGNAQKQITVISNAYPSFPLLELKGTVINK